MKFQVMRRTLDTDLQGQGARDDEESGADVARRHQDHWSRFICRKFRRVCDRRSTHGRGAREIFSQRTRELSQPENPVSHQRKPNSLQSRNSTVRNFI
jgi:hypothetical protein